VPAPKMTRTSDGQTTLTFGLFKSADFLTYQPLPLTIPEATLNPAGELEFRFNVPDDTEFYRLETK
jgi:hypothetical protein